MRELGRRSSGVGIDPSWLKEWSFHPISVLVGTDSALSRTRPRSTTTLVPYGQVDAQSLDDSENRGRLRIADRLRYQAVIAVDAGSASGPWPDGCLPARVIT